MKRFYVKYLSVATITLLLLNIISIEIAYAKPQISDGNFIENNDYSSVDSKETVKTGSERDECSEDYARTESSYEVNQTEGESPDISSESNVDVEDSECKSDNTLSEDSPVSNEEIYDYPSEEEGTNTSSEGDNETPIEGEIETPDYDIHDKDDNLKEKVNEDEEQSFEKQDETTSKETSKDEEVDTLSSKSSTNEESKTSKLGKIENQNVTIYYDETLTESFLAGTDYIDKVYYIKKEARIDGELYLLISNSPSSEVDLVGWINAKDISTHPHTGIDKNKKELFLTGSGQAYSKAWGGSKDILESNLDDYTNQLFEVNLTEKVGEDIWYRGTINGKTVWVHSQFAVEKVENNISKLAHLSSKANIYTILGKESSKVSTHEHTHAVYYVKKEAIINNETYYLLSTSPSSTRDLIGWVNSKELSFFSHTGVDKKTKMLYLTGEGKGYSKAWGGKKDLVIDNLLKYKSHLFEVNLTEKVGNNIWYRGTINGETVWVHSSYVTDSQEKSISMLTHIRSNAVIYKTLGKDSTKISAKEYTHAVYYVKRQATINNETFYLLSTSPSSTIDLIGWVNKKDLTPLNHTSIDKIPKEFYLTGNGKAYSKAWGGSKDLIEADLAKYKSQLFEVNLTEKVGNNIWYRGTINGKTAWLHSSYVTEKEESKTSRLAHLRSKAVIYKTLGKESTKVSAENFTHEVYYVKKQASINNDVFYLLSRSPSSTEDLIGWVHSKDLSTHTHKSVDKIPKEFYLTGKGTSYDKAWGGNKNIVYKDMKAHRGKLFKVNLTEKVGSNTWYRGKVNGKTMWLHSSYVETHLTERYNLTLNEATNMQFKANPQTDKKYAYVSKSYIKNGKVTADNLNVRLGTGTNFAVVGTLSKNDSVTIISDTGNGWYQIKFQPDRQWVNAAIEDVRYYLDPNNFIEDERLRFQFLDLSRVTNATAKQLNEVLNGKGILKEQGQSFIDAGNEYGINELYLISHAFLETGNGTSKLSQGVEVGKNSKGDLVLVTSSNKSNLKDIKKVYNMYGIGAFDNCALDCGAKKAYEEDWTTPRKAIIGGARFIGNSYIQKGQNTLYKMRWNPRSMSDNGYISHQYATDIGWAAKQVNTMYNLYNEFGILNPILEIPVYK